MTIDEAIAEAKDNAKTQREIAEECFEEHIFDEKERIEHLIYANEFEQLAEWLEELKAYKSGDFTRNLQTLVYKQGYNKAIEDFVSRLETVSFTKTQWDLIKTIAEQLKVGGEND